MFVNPKWFVAAMVPVEMPTGARHLHSNVCWCDPIIEVDKNELVLHGRSHGIDLSKGDAA